MMLSAETKMVLEDRYEIWGLEAVRKELEQPDRAQFSDPEVTAFAEAWVKTQETRLRWKWFRNLAVSTLALVALGIALAVLSEI